MNDGKVIHVDGYYPGAGQKPPDINEVIESIPSDAIIANFFSCHWHACPHIQPTGRDQIKCPKTGKTWEEVYTASLNHVAQLESLGCRVVTCWKHEYVKLLVTVPRAQEIHENI